MGMWQLQARGNGNNRSKLHL